MKLQHCVTVQCSLHPASSKPHSDVFFINLVVLLKEKLSSWLVIKLDYSYSWFSILGSLGH